MKLRISKFLIISLAISILGFACALTIKASVGVGAWEAFAQTASEITLIEIGTWEMIFNFACIAIQILILKHNFKRIQLLQIPLNILLGIVINFVLYEWLFTIDIQNYWVNIIILLFGYAVCAYAIGAIMVLDIVTFSLEGACMAFSKATGMKFHQVRQAVDIVLITVCLVISFGLGLPLAIREGTLLGMLIFGPLLGYSMQMWKPIFMKYHFIESK